MPDRSRRTLRLLPRSRPRTNSRPHTSPTSTLTSTSLLISRHSDPIPTIPIHNPHYLSDPGANSLESPSTHSDTFISESRNYSSLPSPYTQTCDHSSHDRRHKRQGGRFEPVLCFAQHSNHDDDHDHTNQAPSANEDLPSTDTALISTETSPSPFSDTLLSELADLRAEQEAQREAMDRLVAAVSAQNARVERHLDELRILDRKDGEPGAARVLLGSVMDAMAALLICFVTWCVARPIGWVWRLVKWVRREEKVEGVMERRRCSWRLSGKGEMLHSDPFLASAAKRLSFTTAADLQD